MLIGKAHMDIVVLGTLSVEIWRYLHQKRRKK